MNNQHEQFMRRAIEEAKKAAEIEEVPVGAVAVVDGKVIATAHNLREATGNPLGHAEILLLEKLICCHPCEGRDPVTTTTDEKRLKIRDWRLEDVTVYVTCEPCIMCAGALLQARVPRLVFGCMDPKAGACGSLYDLAHDKRLNHQIEVTSGVLAEECSKLLKDFFKRLR